MVEFDKKWEAVQKYVGEAARLGLEPNMTTYNHVLNVLRPIKDQRDHLQLGVNCLSEILRKLDAQTSIPLQQPTDQNFFNVAMVIATYANNYPLMDQTEQLYASKKNEVQISSFVHQISFYTLYMSNKLKNMTDIAEIEKLYMGLVPRIVAVTPDLLKIMVRKLKVLFFVSTYNDFHFKGTKNWTLTKRVIEDGLCARRLLDRELLHMFLRLLDEFRPNDEVDTFVY